MSEHQMTQAEQLNRLLIEHQMGNEAVARFVAENAQVVRTLIALCDNQKQSADLYKRALKECQFSGKRFVYGGQTVSKTMSREYEPSKLAHIAPEVLLAPGVIKSTDRKVIEDGMAAGVFANVSGALVEKVKSVSVRGVDVIEVPDPIRSAAALA
jgi:hypothetical protein